MTAIWLHLFFQSDTETIHATGSLAHLRLVMMQRSLSVFSVLLPTNILILQDLLCIPTFGDP